MSELRVAVVGCGDISAVHIDAVAAVPDSTVVGVCEPHEGRRAAAEARTGAPGFASLTELLDAVEPDVVHLCTPHHLHADHAVECLTRDVSVLVEKPLAHSLTAGERLAMAAEDSEAVLGVCFQNRYNDTSRKLRELLDTGAVGTPVGGRASVSWHRDAAYYADRDWRGRWATAGGGVLMNQAIHTLDLLQWYLGPVTDVKGIAATLGLSDVIEVEDTAAIQLHHRADGDAEISAEISSVFHATNCDVENAPIVVEIVTDSASIRLDTDLVVRHDDGRVEVTRPEATGTGQRDYWGVSHTALITDFHQHVRARKPFWLDAAVGLETLRIIDAVYEQSPGITR
ncbi:Gfo/Idh/MocA family protein [Pseudonocardia sp. CA-107938]|uniref:Gfo/Idh/MocA family protein n=1 Tax=Pseudonocardia sp. CA-107938 TaxID=3240021 RepID=UPI003D89E232